MNIDYRQAEHCLRLLNDSTIVSRGVHIEYAIPEDSLLFIGINPSFNEKDPIPGHENYRATYRLADTADNAYFKKAYTIATGNNLNFGHHDLFPVRERNQKVIENLFVDENGILKPKEDHSSFIEKSLRWSEDIIFSVRPQMIVVINAFASRIFFDYRFREDGHSLLGFQAGDKQLWSAELGTDFIRIDGQSIPILFSGMLSGQRALDHWSYSRLSWHIQHVLSNKKKWPE